jgi:hypothetical protein
LITLSPDEYLFSSIASTTIWSSDSERPENKKDYLSLWSILLFVSSDLLTILGLKSLFLFQSPKASAETEDLGPFFEA